MQATPPHIFCEIEKRFNKDIEENVTIIGVPTKNAIIRITSEDSEFYNRKFFVLTSKIINKTPHLLINENDLLAEYGV